MVNVYIDESGNAGFLDPAQPVFALSALVISEDDAVKAKSILPATLLQGEELKHERLSKDSRRKVREGLVGLQRELLTGHPALAYVMERRFCLIQKLLMDCVPGDDLRALWIQRMAMDIYRQYDELVSSIGLDEILVLYDRVSGTQPEDSGFEEGLADLQARLRFASSRSTVVGFALGGFANGDYAWVDEFRSSCGRPNLHFSLVVGLLNEMFKIVRDDVRLVFDESPQTRKLTAVWNTPFFPLVKEVAFESSGSCLGVQLADILAGGARLVGERQFKCAINRAKEKVYCDELEKIYAETNALLYQPPYCPVLTFGRVRELFVSGKS